MLRALLRKQKEEIMASNMQSPESFEKESIQAFERYNSSSLQLSSIIRKEHEDDEDVDGRVLQQIQRPFSISSNSPLSNDFEGEDENTWPERLDLPLTDFEKYDSEPPSCSAYETIASEDMDDRINGPGCYNYCFSQDEYDTTEKRINGISSADLYNSEAMQPQIEGSDVDSCLEWPTGEQESMSCNELSDVILDSCRLSKETSILLKLLDEGSLPSTVVVCVGNDSLSKNSTQHQPLASSSNGQQSLQSGTHTETRSVNAETNEPRSIFSTIAGYGCDPEKHSFINVCSGAGLQRSPFAPKFDYRAMVNKPLQSFEELAYEAKVERQHKRKEKNRECSRNFRYKQRLKEDCLKKGKLEKEVFLRSRLYERERLRSALVELARNCASCPKAMEFLSSYHETHEKENIPAQFEGQTRSFTS